MKAKGIQKLAKAKRPRERLVASGAENLTNPELVALILGSGNRKNGVLRMAKEVAKKVRMSKEKRDLSLENLTEVNGIGPVLAGKILASLELGYRYFSQEKKPRILSPNDSMVQVEEIRGSQREQLVGLYLNARYELLKREVLAVGSLNAQNIDVRDVFAPAVKLPCRCVILAHNHPSGSTQPSEDDLKTTEKLQKAGKLFGINLLDHLIVTKDDYLSFQEAGLL